MIKNVIILVLMLGLLYSYSYNREVALSAKAYEQVALELSDELVKVSRQLNSSSCVLRIMTEVSKGNYNTIKSLDHPCRHWTAKDEAIACINERIRNFCGIPNN